MSQIKTRRISYSAIVGSAAFQAGVKDYQNGVANFDNWPNKAWRYERGRLFAASRAAAKLDVPSSRFARRVSAAAIGALVKAFSAGDVI